MVVRARLMDLSYEDIGEIVGRDETPIDVRYLGVHEYVCVFGNATYVVNTNTGDYEYVFEGRTYGYYGYTEAGVDYLTVFHMGVEEYLTFTNVRIHQGVETYCPRGDIAWCNAIQSGVLSKVLKKCLIDPTFERDVVEVTRDYAGQGRQYITLNTLTSRFVFPVSGVDYPLPVISFRESFGSVFLVDEEGRWCDMTDRLGLTLDKSEPHDTTFGRVVKALKGWEGAINPGMFYE